MASRRLTFRVPASRRDEWIAELWALGTSGVHERAAQDGEGRLDAYFERDAAPRGGTLERLLARCGGELLESVEVEDRDWLAAYRESARPIAVGPFVVDPREPELAAPEERLDRLRIPARNAFGTGSHESTRLILEELAGLDPKGRTVLDVGTGSGILALAALRLGARSVVALDPDAPSVAAARDNARLNGLAPRLLAGHVAAVRGRFDVVLVNILPHRWLSEAAAVTARLGRGGALLISGLLAGEEPTLLAAPALARLEVLARRDLGEWRVLRLARASEG